MAVRVAAKRYSKAVFELALERNQLERWQSDLEEIASIKEDAALLAWLRSPRVSFGDKARLLKQKLDKVSPLALNLVYLLVSKGKFELIDDIKDELRRLVDGHLGIQRAEVTTAAPLEPEDRLKLEKYLGELLGKKVIIESRVDASIIAGFKVKTYDKLLDASTKSKLEGLKKELIGAK